MSGKIQQALTTNSPPETVFGMVVSLAFWFCLLVSAVLFSSVALSPKLLIYLQLRHQYEENQLALVESERQANQLQRVVDAIRSDKEFAAELTRIEFDAVRPGEEVIPVDATLKLNMPTSGEYHSSQRAAIFWYEPSIKFLASDIKSRVLFLGCAAVLIVISFALLPATSNHLSAAKNPGNSNWHTLQTRYMRQVP